MSRQNQCADRLIEATPTQLSLVHQMQLIGTYLVGPEQLRRAVEVAGKQRDLPDVAVVVYRDRLRTCMSWIILWRSGVMIDSSSCRDTWPSAPGAALRSGGNHPSLA